MPSEAGKRVLRRLWWRRGKYSSSSCTENSGLGRHPLQADSAYSSHQLWGGGGGGGAERGVVPSAHSLG